MVQGHFWKNVFWTNFSPSFAPKTAPFQGGVGGGGGGGGGGGISGVLTQSGRFFGRFRKFGPRLVWTLPESCPPPPPLFGTRRIQKSRFPDPTKRWRGYPRSRTGAIFKKFATGLAYVQGFHRAWPGAPTYHHSGKFQGSSKLCKISCRIHWCRSHPSTQRYCRENHKKLLAV